MNPIESTFEVSADWVWAGDATPCPSVVRVEGGRIAAVEPGKRADLHFDGLLLSGLVNAHVHLDLTFPPEGEQLEGRFTDWLLRIKELRDAEGAAGLEAAARRGVARSLTSGCTLLIDYDSGGFSLAALAESPIRRVVLREVIRFHDDAAALAELDDFVAGENSGRELRGVAPHAPYTVHPELLPRLIEWARAHGRPWSTHIAEQPWEEEFLVAGTGPLADFFATVGIDLTRFGVRGTSAARHLAREEQLQGGWLVHGNYLQPDEINAIAAAGAAVVFCPRSHRWFQHQPHPLAELHAAGVPLCWGTDGQVSNGDVSVLAEMREVRRAFPDYPAIDILRSATSTPRAHLTRHAGSSHFGSGQLSPGDPADFCVIPTSATTPDQVFEEVLTTQHEPSAVYVDGVCVVGAPV